MLRPHPPELQTLKGDKVQPGSAKPDSLLAKVSKGPQNDYCPGLMCSLPSTHHKDIGVLLP